MGVRNALLRPLAYPNAANEVAWFVASVDQDVGQMVTRVLYRVYHPYLVSLVVRH
jgi:hypothetical protein